MSDLHDAIGEDEPEPDIPAEPGGTVATQQQIAQRPIEFGLPQGFVPTVDEAIVWDTLVLNGHQWPGITSIKVKRQNKWDRKIAKGEHGETPTYSGASNADITITNKTWTYEQRKLLQERLAEIEPEPGKGEPQPHDISHPVTEVRNVKSILIESIDGPEESGAGIYITTISAFESRPPKPAAPLGGGTGNCAQLQARAVELFAAINIEAVQFGQPYNVYKEQSAHWPELVNLNAQIAQCDPNWAPLAESSNGAPQDPEAQGAWNDVVDAWTGLWE